MILGASIVVMVATFAFLFEKEGHVLPTLLPVQIKMACSDCGTENASDAVYCKRCGKRLV